MCKCPLGGNLWGKAHRRVYVCTIAQCMVSLGASTHRRGNPQANAQRRVNPRANAHVPIVGGFWMVAGYSWLLLNALLVAYVLCITCGWGGGGKKI